MAYVPGVKNDLFISYAHVDNEPDPHNARWVSGFVRAFTIQLKQRLGSDALEVFFDESGLHAHHHLDILLENARNSAIFVAILSPSYVLRQWTMKELQAFASAGGPKPRFIVVEKLPLNSPAERPTELKDYKRTLFWRPNERSGAPSTVTPVTQGGEYSQQLETLAEQIKKLMLEMRTGKPQEDGQLQDDHLRDGQPDTRAHHASSRPQGAHADTDELFFGVGGIALCLLAAVVMIWMDLNSGPGTVVIFLLIGFSVFLATRTLRLWRKAPPGH